MSFGLIDVYNNSQKGVMQGLETAAQLERQRDMTNKQIESQEKQSRIGAAATGAGLGMQMGAAAGLPGMAIGGTIGGLAGFFSMDLF